MSNESKHLKVSHDWGIRWPPTFVHSALCGSGSFIFWTRKRSVWTEGTCHCNISGFSFCCLCFEDRFHIDAPYMTHAHKTEAPLSWEDTLSNVHTPSHAGPPTLLEDGQCYRGNQFKQGLDGREVVRLAGKDMHHLKQQDVTSDTAVPEEEVGSLGWKGETLCDIQPMCAAATRSRLDFGL